MINTIIFDFDNTLYEYEPCHRMGLKASLNELMKYLNLKYESLELAYKQSQKEVKAHLINQAASHSRLLYFKNICERYSLNAIKLPLILEEIYWKTFLDYMQLKPGVIELLSDLKSREFKVGMCTDLTAHIQLRKIERLKIEEYFDVIVTSEEAGVEKPNPYIFEFTLSKLNSKASESIFIGDSIEKDIKGAIANGMKAIYLNDMEASEYLCALNINQVHAIINKVCQNEQAF